MKHNLKKLVYLIDKNRYYIPCIITDKCNDTFRVTLNNNHLQFNEFFSTIVCKEELEKPLMNTSPEVTNTFIRYSSLIPCYIISQEYSSILGTTNLVLDFLANGAFLVDKENVVVYDNSLEYFYSLKNEHSELLEFPSQQKYCITFATSPIKGVKQQDYNKQSTQQKLIDQFNKGNFKSVKGKPLFAVESLTEQEHVSFNHIGEKVAELAIEKFNIPKVGDEVGNRGFNASQGSCMVIENNLYFKNNKNEWVKTENQIDTKKKYNSLNNQKVLIEFYGGPSSGKSLHAYDLSNFLKLKLQDKVVEFSKEQAQEMYWEGRISSMSNMIKVLGRQTEHYDVRFEGGADVVVADTSIDLACYYDKTITSPTAKRMIMLDMYDKYPNRIKVLCIRNNDKSTYTTTGRLQTFEESKAIDKVLEIQYTPFDVKTSDENWQEKVLTLAQKMMYND